MASVFFVKQEVRSSAQDMERKGRWWEKGEQEPTRSNE